MSYEPPPAPDQPPFGASPVGPRPAELLDRFVARLIDFVLLFVVNNVVTAVIVVGVIMGESGGTGLGMGGSFAVSAVTAVLSTIIYLGYFGFMESSRGQTVGKMIMKLHTVGPQGGNPTMEQALRRNIWTGFGILGIVPVLGGIVAAIGELVAVIMIAVGINKDAANRQAWHDEFAGGTRVIKEG
jgi:uncharacterized RDD family membrane protein YckC